MDLGLLAARLRGQQAQVHLVWILFSQPQAASLNGTLALDSEQNSLDFYTERLQVATSLLVMSGVKSSSKVCCVLGTS